MNNRILDLCILVLTGVVIGFFIVILLVTNAKSQNLPEKDFETVRAQMHTNAFLPDGNPIKMIAVEYSPAVIRAISGGDSLVNEMIGEGDTLTFLITLINTQFPCVAPILTSTGQPIINQVDLPCEEFLISDIQSKLYLENGKDRIYPFYVWGRRNDYLTQDETMFAKFRVGIRGWRWTDHSTNIGLVYDIKYPIVLTIK